MTWHFVIRRIVHVIGRRKKIKNLLRYFESIADKTIFGCIIASIRIKLIEANVNKKVIVIIKELFKIS